VIRDQQPRVFDELAGTYDDSFTDRLPGQWLRSMVQARIADLLPREAEILEVGCGTGEDAIHFARLGHNVTATDVSNEMLAQTRRKLAGASPDVRDRVRVDGLDAADPDSAGLPCDCNLDLVFSNFGALNCVADPQPLFEYANHRLLPGGHLAITMMGRFCAWETLGFAARGDFRRATRRWRGNSQFKAGGVEQRVSYPTIAAIRRIVPANFRLTAVYAVGALLPNSEFFNLCERWPKSFRKLAVAENAIAGWWPVNRLGDHFMMVLRKESEGRSN
jgi:SAM-dependent methyltransferase